MSGLTCDLGAAPGKRTCDSDRLWSSAEGPSRHQCADPWPGRARDAPGRQCPCRAGVGSGDAEGSFALWVVITGELPGADRALQPRPDRVSVVVVMGFVILSLSEGEGAVASGRLLATGR